MQSFGSLTCVVAPPYYSSRLRTKFRVCDADIEQRVGIPFASIPFHPDFVQFQQRVAQSQFQGQQQACLPAGWPQKMIGPMAWDPSGPPSDSAFVYRLSQEELDDIDRALRQHQSQGIALHDISQKNFQLPVLAPHLATVREEVYNGVGCRVLRGLDVTRYTADELSIIFCGVSSHVAAQRGKQDQEGSMLRHIVDFDRAEACVDLPFHTDVVCDVVATLTRACADRGGTGTLASGWTVYNDLAARRPDLVQVLAAEDWPLDTYGRAPAFYRRGLLYHVDGKVVFNFSRRVLTGHPLSPRSEGIPGLTERQAEALDAVHFSARAHQATVSMERGDIRFVNNMGILHGREAFRDVGGPEQASKRHLLRLWLHDRQMVWKLPRALQLAWERTFDDDTRDSRWDAEPQRNPDGSLIGNQMSQCD